MTHTLNGPGPEAEADGFRKGYLARALERAQSRVEHFKTCMEVRGGPRTTDHVSVWSFVVVDITAFLSADPVVFAYRPLVVASGERCAESTSFC